MKVFPDILRNFAITLLSVLLIASCDDEDSFSSSYSNQLSFELETLSLDTVFSKIASPYKMVKVYNRSGDGIRISSVRQQRGAASSGFRVNVNASYLDPELNNQVNDLELRNGDSIRIWVKMASTDFNESEKPVKVEDQLVFTLESGRQQTLNLNAWTWDADTMQNRHITGNYTIDNSNGKPLIVYGTLTVDSLATLNIAKGSNIYFHQDGGIDVKGTLKVQGEAQNNVTLRSDRLDSLLNLKYDNIPGKWQGIRFYGYSFDNELNYTDLHGASYGLQCDSTFDANRTTVSVNHSTIHNILGNGISSHASTVIVENTQISNTQGNCIDIHGGKFSINSSTIAQFYEYSTGRRKAFSCTETFNDTHFPIDVTVRNSIITGLSDDEVWYTPYKTDSIGNIRFYNSLLRTVNSPEVKDVFSDCIFEDLEDTINGKQNFVKYDSKQFEYDFTPRQGSYAIGSAKQKAADKDTSAADDRNGKARKETPDMGCYETFYPEASEEKE